MRLRDIDLDALPIEAKLKLALETERRERVEDWVTAGLCVAMMLSVTVPTINATLDKLTGFSPSPAGRGTEKTAPAPSVGTVGGWDTKVKPGMSLGKGLVAGNRTFFPCTKADSSDCTRHPITGVIGKHRGQDVGAPYGMPVYAVTQGSAVKVTCLYQEGGAGNYAIIQPDAPVTVYGKTYKGGYFISMHLSECYSGVFKKGAVIGKVGSTGSSTAPHIHFEVKTPNAVVPTVEALRMHITGEP